MRPLTVLAGALLLVVTSAADPVRALAEQASQPTATAAGQLDAGRNHTCAILAGGRVRCWGFSGEGELGYGNQDTIGDDETPGSAGPVEVGSGRVATAISAGDYHTCARLDDGGVRCWGFGANGRLGYGNKENIGDDETPGSIAPVSLGTGRTATAISAGNSHTCALLDDGNVRCWGFGYYGQLGNGEGDPNNPTDPAVHPQDIGDNETPGQAAPVNLGIGRTAVAVTAGFWHSCALLDDGSVRCWGYGHYGQLGYGNRANVNDPSAAGPVNLGAGRKAVAISAGGLQTCAVLDNGSVRCWGFGSDGRLGYGNENTIGDDETPGDVAPVELGPGRTAVAISVGDSHVCAQLDSGTLLCWGSGLDGRLGYGNQTTIGDDETPASTGPVNLGASTAVAAISLGSRHSCARLNDASVRCWGNGANGRLGYCNEMNIGDDETPGSVGPVPLELAFRAPHGGFAGCARGAADESSTASGAAGIPNGDSTSPLEGEVARKRGFRACLKNAARHTRRELSRARHSTERRLARLKRHIKRHRSRLRRACQKRYGRTPGQVRGLSAMAISSTTVVLTFNAPGSDGNRPPAARSYVVKQSRRPIRRSRDFRRAQTLCKGRCRFPTVGDVGAAITLTVTDLLPRTTYYYVVAARDNVTHQLGPHSGSVKARTR